MRRRDFLGAAAALSGTVALPSIGSAQNARTLRFVPQSDVTVLDPHWTTAYVTRNHGAAIFDTLYGIDGSFKAQPQMVEGHRVENDGKLWTLTLRTGLKFHDGERVLAKDCVASIDRWSKRDAFGQALMLAVDEMSAKDDRTIVFRMKKPFALLPDALGKVSPFYPAIMPERLAKTDPFKQVTEMVGSGPFRFRPDERVVGSRVVYERFADYVPVPSGKPDWTSGPKIANFDRVEWTVMPDPATAFAAVQNGEVDWWEYIQVADLVDGFRKMRNVKVDIQDPTGFVSILRMNQLFPPFDNPAIRRALLEAIDESDFMTAVAGDDKSMWRADVGVFPPETPLASQTDLKILTGKRDPEKAKADIKAAGYKGEKVVLMAPTDQASLKALADVAGDVLQKVGLNVDIQAMDWGSVVQRRSVKNAPDQGGWNVFCTNWTGLDQLTPATHLSIRGNGPDGWFGWPTAPKIEELRNAWFDAPDVPAQKRIADDIQRQVFVDVPYIPLGQYKQATAYRSDIVDVPRGFAIFWGVKRA